MSLCRAIYEAISASDVLSQPFGYSDERPESPNVDVPCRDLLSPLQHRLLPSGLRKERSYADRVTNGSNRPFAALQDRLCERAGSARKRTLAEGSVAPVESFIDCGKAFSLRQVFSSEKDRRLQSERERGLTSAPFAGSR
jgi:hypothetical protein